MKKLVVSVGIIALGSSVLHAVETGALNAQQKTKAWSVSASLRGFYDDNINSQPSGSETSSTGISISPSVDFGVAGEQSSFNLGYDFSANYYDKPVNGATDHTDYTHNFNLNATHAFSEQFRMNASEQFVIGQEPDLQSGPIDNPQRVSGNNVRNYASIGANMQATSLLGFGASYNNTIVDYEDEGSGSLSARLDRMEHGVNLNSQWTLSPQSVGILGVRLGRTEYTRDPDLIVTGGVQSSARDSRSFVLMGGVEHEFSSNLSGSFLVGGQRVEFPNNPTTEAEWSPWTECSLTYQYQEQTSLTGGFSYSRSATDQTGASSATDFVRDQQTAQVYASVSHDFVQQLTGTGSVRYNNSTFNGGGSLDGTSEQLLLISLGLSYEFTPNLAGNVGYNYDDLSSDAARPAYDRNKFYVGVTAKY